MATPATIRVDQETTFTPTLFLAFELGVNKWKLGCTTGAAQRPREWQVPAGDCPAVLEEIRRAKSRFGFPAEARVVRCYEAGRDGFWLHRFFVSPGIENAVVDAASIEVQRRYRRAKTERLEVHTLLTMLRRHAAGAKKVWSVVRVPSVADEDRRQLHRELLTTKRDRTRVSNRIKGLLAGCGIRMGLHGDVETQLDAVRQWDGALLPAALRARLKRAWQKVQPLTEQIGNREAERRVALRPSEERVMEQVRQLATLRGIGQNKCGPVTAPLIDLVRGRGIIQGNWFQRYNGGDAVRVGLEAEAAIITANISEGHAFPDPLTPVRVVRDNILLP